MQASRFFMAALVALAAASCAQQHQASAIDPATGQPVPSERGLFSSQALAQAPSAQASGERGLLNSQALAPRQNNQPIYEQAAAPASEDRGLFSSRIFAQAPSTQASPSSERGLLSSQSSGASPQTPSGRGLFSAQSDAPPVYAQRLQPPSVLQYVAPQPAAPRYSAPQFRAYASSAAPPSYAYAPSGAQPYTLGPGDKLRVVVFGQDGISNTYIVDAAGNVSLPLIGAVVAHGLTTQQLSARIAERLRQGYVRDPHVSVEVETYRPFFILGEVTTPGQYPYVADMTVEKAVAIAGGFTPRAYKDTVQLTRSAAGDQMKGPVPLNYPLRPGDTILVKERWF